MPKTTKEPKRVTPDNAHPEISNKTSIPTGLNLAFVNNFTRRHRQRFLRNHNKIAIPNFTIQSRGYPVKVGFVGFPVTGCNSQSRVLSHSVLECKVRLYPNKS